MPLTQVRRVLGKVSKYVGEEERRNFVLWWPNNAQLFTGINGTAVDKDRLVVTYLSRDAREAQRKIEHIRHIIAKEFTERGSKKSIALLEVSNPEAWLVTPEESRWNLVDWFKDETYRLPGIAGMKKGNMV